MALSSSRLAAALRAKLLTVTGFQDNAATTAFATAIAEAVLDEITDYAALNVTVTSVSGVTTGAGVSGSGSGTGTIS